MTYRSDVDPRGATIDGEPDAVNAGRIGWETVDGPQGGLSMVHRMKTDIPSLGWTSYYFDDKTPATSGAEKQCTGDSAAYGSSGPFVNQGIPNTDPRATPFNSLVDERTVFYELPGKSDGPKRSKQVDEPMEIQVLPHD
jgi:hypothetical protein